LAPSMMGSRITRDSTLACGTEPCLSWRSSALPFVTTPDNRLRYKRNNSSLCTEGRCRRLVHPRRLRTAGAQGSDRPADNSDAHDRMCDGLKFESEQGPPPIIQPPSPVPGGWSPTLHVLELGSATGRTKETIIPQKLPPPRPCRALAGCCILHPPDLALLFPLPDRPTPGLSATLTLGLLQGCSSLANNQRQDIWGSFPEGICFERTIRIARSQRDVISFSCHYLGLVLRQTSLEQRFGKRFRT